MWRECSGTEGEIAVKGLLSKKHLEAPEAWREDPLPQTSGGTCLGFEIGSLTAQAVLDEGPRSDCR